MGHLVFVLDGQTEADRGLRANLDTHLRAIGLQVHAPLPGAPLLDDALAAVAKARAAVILVSADCINQDGRLLAEVLLRHDRDPGRFPIFPIVARQCVWDGHGGLAGRQVWHLADGDQHEVWTRVARALQAPAAQPPAPLPLPAPQRQTGTRHTMLVTLVPTAGGVQVSYRSAQRGLGPRRAGPVADASGAALAALLFPDPALAEEAFKDVLGTSEPSHQPARLRVCTDDPQLSGLPWQRLSVHGRPIVQDGWTVEVGAAAGRGAYTLPAPFRTLVHAPLDSALSRLLCEKLRRLGPQCVHEEFFRVTYDRAALGQALRGMAPDFVVSAVPGVELRLAPDRLGGAPRIVYREGDEPDAARRLSPGVDLLLAARPGHEAAARDLLLRWLEVWQGEGLDPVLALHQCWPALPACPLAVFADYDSIETRRLERHRANPQGARGLNRDDQRAMVDKHIKELVRGPRLCEALLAYAGPGNLLSRFPEQIIDFHDEYQGQSRAPVLIHHERLTFPSPEDGPLDKALPRALDLCLDRAAGETVLQMLRRRAPERHIRGTTVMLLDFGTHGVERLTVKGKEIETWLTFCREHLTRNCPAELRLLPYLGHEIAPERHRNFHNMLDRKSAETTWYTDRFRFTVLPALGDVSQRHLMDFLTHPDNTLCPALLAPEAARLIHQSSRGGYEAAAALIERGEAESWTGLVEALRGEQSGDEEY